MGSIFSYNVSITLQDMAQMKRNPIHDTDETV